jgi:hypothetical protein
MATRVIVQQICDPCGEYAEGVEITTMRIVLDGKEYDVDICEDHKADMHATWLHVARKAEKPKRVPNGGKSLTDPVKAQKAAEGDYTPSGVLRTLECPVKGCGRKFGEQRALSKHKSMIHGIPTLKR